MPKIFTSQKQKKGELGETIAVKYLEGKGFHVKERNYTKKWGEIDIIAEKEGKLCFIEVKAVSFNVSDNVYNEIGYTGIRPEENLTNDKIKRLKRAIQTYLLDHKVPRETEWQFDLMCVYLDDVKRKAKVRVIDNIIL